MRSCYERQISLKEVGKEGQKKLLSSKVLVVGAGGLGSPALIYLAGAGIGKIGIVDNDVVSESNLNRQILYDTYSIGKKKVDCAVKRLGGLNPDCSFIAYDCVFDKDNAFEIVSGYDVVVDATDNIKTRYVINDACVKAGSPFVYGGVCRFSGQLSVFNYKGSATYRDLYPDDSDVATYSEPKELFGPLTGIIGALQASQAIKIILGLPVMAGKLFTVNLLDNTFDEFFI